MHSFYGYNADGISIKSYSDCQNNFEFFDKKLVNENSDIVNNTAITAITWLWKDLIAFSGLEGEPTIKKDDKWIIIVPPKPDEEQKQQQKDYYSNNVRVTLKKNTNQSNEEVLNGMYKITITVQSPSRDSKNDETTPKITRASINGVTNSYPSDNEIIFDNYTIGKNMGQIVIECTCDKIFDIKIRFEKIETDEQIYEYKIIYGSDSDLDYYKNIQFIGNSDFEKYFCKYDITSGNIIHLYFLNPFVDDSSKDLLDLSINFKMIVYK